MKSYKLLYLFLLVPAYLLGLTIHQASVYYGIHNTYEEGESYNAEVVDFNIKQIAAQTNGYVVLRFETHDGNIVQRKLSLPVDMASFLTDTQVIPVRFQPGNFEEIVIIPTYKKQRSIIMFNMGVAFIGFLITGVIGYFTHVYIRRKDRGEIDDEFTIERVDS